MLLGLRRDEPPELRDVSVVVTGEPGTFTTMGETDMLSIGAEGNPPSSYPTLAMPLPGTLLDASGRSVVLMSPLRILQRTPMRIRDGAPRTVDDHPAVPTVRVELPAGGTFWVREGKVAEREGRIEITAVHQVLVLGHALPGKRP